MDTSGSQFNSDPKIPKGQAPETAAWVDDFETEFRQYKAEVKREGRSPAGAAMLAEVKDQLSTMRRNKYWEKFMVQEEINALMPLIGKKQVEASEWSIKGAQAELDNAHKELERAHGKKKMGILTVIGAVVAVAGIFMTGGASGGFELTGLGLA